MLIRLILQDLGLSLSICIVGSHGATRLPVACHKNFNNCLCHPGTLPSDYGQGWKSTLHQTIPTAELAKKKSTVGG